MNKAILVSRYGMQAREKSVSFQILGGIQAFRRHFLWIFTSVKLKNDGLKQQMWITTFRKLGKLSHNNFDERLRENV